jgi:hypothetical protein
MENKNNIATTEKQGLLLLDLDEKLKPWSNNFLHIVNRVMKLARFKTIINDLETEVGKIYLLINKENFSQIHPSYEHLIKLVEILKTVVFCWGEGKNNSPRRELIKLVEILKTVVFAAEFVEERERIILLDESCQSGMEFFTFLVRNVVSEVTRLEVPYSHSHREMFLSLRKASSDLNSLLLYSGMENTRRRNKSNTNYRANVRSRSGKDGEAGEASISPQKIQSDGEVRRGRSPGRKPKN